MAICRRYGLGSTMVTRDPELFSGTAFIYLGAIIFFGGGRRGPKIRGSGDIKF